jgi:Tetracyclin repressor-like, C-terminal domain
MEMPYGFGRKRPHGKVTGLTRLLREFVGQQLFRRVGHLVGGSAPTLRIELAAGQMIGVAMLRYVLKVEPISSTSTNELVGWLGPVLSGYLSPGGRNIPIP